MANKHGAGCTCCEGNCGPCEKFIQTITFTYSGETIAVNVGKYISELPGCSILERVCLGNEVTTLLDYSAATEFDPRVGDYWKKIIDDSAGCCSASSGPGGGGFESTGPFGDGPFPTIPANCTPCSEAESIISTYPGIETELCHYTRFFMTLPVITNYNLKIDLVVRKSLVVGLQFSDAGGGQVRIRATLALDLFPQICSKLSYDFEWYYNDNCPAVNVELEDCPLCTDVVIQGENLCITLDEPCGAYVETIAGQSPGPTADLFRAYEFFNCARDTPNWVKYAEGSHCSTYTYRDISNPDCCPTITPCSEGANTFTCNDERPGFTGTSGFEGYGSVGYAPRCSLIQFVGNYDYSTGQVWAPSLTADQLPCWDVDLPPQPERYTSPNDTNACECDGDTANPVAPGASFCGSGIVYDKTLDCADICEAHAYDTYSAEDCGTFTIDIDECIRRCSMEAYMETLGSGSPYVNPSSPCYLLSGLCSGGTASTVTVNLDDYKLPSTGADMDIVCTE
jgi:hypothetical protein